MRGTIMLFAVAGVACGTAASEQSSRQAESARILEEVFRFELRQFVDTAGEPAGTVACVGIGEGERTVDPPGDLVARLGRGSGVAPASRCGATEAFRLTAGPIEWTSDTDVRVKGAFRKSAGSSIPLLYRVVLEAGTWRCLGPIMTYAPL